MFKVNTQGPNQFSKLNTWYFSFMGSHSLDQPGVRIRDTCKDARGFTVFATNERPNECRGSVLFTNQGPTTISNAEVIDSIGASTDKPFGDKVAIDFSALLGGQDGKGGLPELIGGTKIAPPGSLTNGWELLAGLGQVDRGHMGAQVGRVGKPDQCNVIFRPDRRVELWMYE